MTNEKGKVIAVKMTVFDCDPGIDDSFALFLISKLNIKVDYYVATFGNDKQCVTKKNLEVMSEYLSLGGELADGCVRSLDGTVPECGNFHGSDGLAEISDEIRKKFPPKKSAEIDCKMLAQKLNSCDEITYFAVGPLTTLATLISINPKLKSKIKNVFVMGGGIEKFNKEYDTEYNFYADGKAVKKVFESGMKITIFPLDLTMNCGIKKDVIEELEKQNNYPEMITMLKHNYSKNSSFGNDFAILHDTLPVLYSVYPNNFTVKEMLLSADENGHIEVSQNGNEINVATAMKNDLLVEKLKLFFNGEHYE